MLGLLDRLRASPHRWCRENLSAYMDGELSPREHERVRSHLEQCEDCRRELQGLERTVALLRRLPQARAPRPFFIPETAPAPSLPVWMRPWAYGALRMATAAVAILFVVTVAGNALAKPAYLRSAAPLNYGISARGADTQDVGAAEQASPAAEMLSVPAPTEPATEPAALAAAGAPIEEPTLTPDEEARKTAAPPGMGGGAETVTPPPAAAPPVSAEAQPTAEPTPAALAAVPEPKAQVEAAEAPAEPPAAGEMEDEPSYERGADTYGMSGLQAARLQLGRYPWRLWAAATAVLLAVLAAATLWLRAARARWP